MVDGLGGEAENGQPHALLPSSRHADDILIWKNGGTFRGDGSRNEDYWAWNQPVYSPSDGIVTFVHDEDRDNPFNIPPDAFGNAVGIQTAPDELLELWHFKRKSIRARVGDRVEAGKFIGSSGISFQPHLHIQLRTGTEIFDPEAIGLPLAFSNIFVDGKPVKRGVPGPGAFVQHDDRAKLPSGPKVAIASARRQPRRPRAGAAKSADAMTYPEKVRIAVGPLNGQPLTPWADSATAHAVRAAARRVERRDREE